MFKQLLRWGMTAGAVALLALAAHAQTSKVPQRSEIDPKYQWKLTDIYPSDSAWEKDFAWVKENYPRIEQFKGKLGSSAQTLLAALKLRDSLGTRIDNLSVYASLSLDQDNRVSARQEMSDRIGTLSSQVNSASAYMEPEILAMDKATLDGYLASSQPLAEYRFYLESLYRTKAHILSDKEEALLASAGPVLRSFGRIFSMADDADITYGSIKDDSGKQVELSKGRYEAFIESPDRRVRRDAFLAYNDGYMKFLNTLSATLSSSVKKDDFVAKTRKYPTTLDMKLDNDSIPTSVFFNLIKAANANLEPLHKWAALRKRLMKLDTLHPYDLWMPLFQQGRRTYTYEQAEQVVLNGLQPLGKTYLADFQKGLSSGWVDVYENQGKGSGAYQTGSYEKHPYVLLNFNGTLSWVFTLAHEMGHAMNSYYTDRHEPYEYAGHSLFTAEVASTCNEAVLMKYMLEQAKTKEEKLALLNYYIDQIIGTFYTQVWFSEFELAIHDRVEKGQALSADFFRKTYRDIYQKYWGPDLVIDSVGDIGGLRIPHFYYAYYVYQYATCYAAAQTLSQNILDKKPGALEKYQTFLNTGSSKYPVDILKDAGVDMTTTEPVDRTIKLFGQLVDQVDKLVSTPEKAGK